ncbi:hypothetical protein AFL01nite_27030 [Aeromicrobium flavum]|uniref:Lipoprotein n=1 Tax=Aeromicrobium flavum TaxID=416568 RepID=A0A512HY39_9ACTN|nr:hypothetical protein [Aeromicrobium flavum]GEO90376.1 hypothetical protein AFL01nite_27030 [Aeromicrobium flavum]
MAALRRLVLAVGAALTLSACSSPGAFDDDVVDQRKTATRAVEKLRPPLASAGSAVAVAGRDVCRHGEQSFTIHEPTFACAVGRTWVVLGARTDAGVLKQIETMKRWVDYPACDLLYAAPGLEAARQAWVGRSVQDPTKLPAGMYECGDVRVSVHFMSLRDMFGEPSSDVHSMSTDGEEVVSRMELPPDLVAELRERGDPFVWWVGVITDYAYIE